MKIFKKETVLDSALERIRYLFDEFPNIVIGMSGGKDSTVIFNLALQIAKEKNRLPLNVLWIDQEGEWIGTVDYVKKIMTMPEVKPYWLQMPMVITNNANSYERYSYCWEESEKENWIHQKHPISIKENRYGTDRFKEIFDNVLRVEFGGVKTCLLGGVRAEESPSRLLTLTSIAKYKGITWGKTFSKKLDHYAFYPIYDWSYTDVWKYINDNNIEYNRIYDEFYRHGTIIKEMRISNLHHETSIHTLKIVQKIEPKLWDRLQKRIPGASSIKQLKNNSFICPKKLPFMFKNWEEYAIHLADNIIQEDKYKALLMGKIKTMRKFYDSDLIYDSFWRVIINTILSSDWDFTKLGNWLNNAGVFTYRRIKSNPDGSNNKKHVWMRSLLQPANTKYLTLDQKHKLVEYFSDERNKK